MIMGDAADGIPGLKGYGPKKAEKIIKKGMTPYQCTKVILKEYQKNCLTLQEAKNQVRLYYKLLKLQKVNVEMETAPEPALAF